MPGKNEAVICKPIPKEVGTRIAKHWFGKDENLYYSISNQGNPDSQFFWLVHLYTKGSWSRSGNSPSLEKAIEQVRIAIGEAQEYHISVAKKIGDILKKRATYHETAHKTEMVTVTAPRSSAKTILKKPKIF